MPLIGELQHRAVLASQRVEETGRGVPRPLNGRGRGDHVGDVCIRANGSDLEALRLGNLLPPAVERPLGLVAISSEAQKGQTYTIHSSRTK